MDPDRWTKLATLFETAVDLSPQSRGAFLERIEAEDPALHAELVSLLRAQDSSGSFLEHAPASLMSLPAGEEQLPAGGRLGQWRLVRLIGRGGMGEVYEARRDTGDYDQRAALKVMRQESAAQLNRFNAERQILARLSHPGIAKLLDGGITPDGRLYLVMEYIDGLAINEYCDSVKAGLAARLALFLQVCDAVSYAHRHLIVHRDIKPANVLVDADGHAHLLDFGIAKPLDASLDSAQAGMTQAMATPDYAAPEQLAGEPISTATDVHALGVLLFVLLAGRTPWEIAGQPVARALHVVLDRSAPRASTMAVETGERPISARTLEGDLDAIIAKCLRREARHRYATVEALVLDIERSRRGDAVSARGDATLYVLGRFAHRYRWAVAAVAAIIVVLSLGIGATAWQAQRAQREAARAVAARDFLIGVFKASDPRIAQDKPRGQITARELLDASVSRLDRQFAADPQTQIELLGLASEIYRELDEEQRYQELHRRHLEMARARYGADDERVLSALLDEAASAVDRLDHAHGQRLLDEIDAPIRRSGADRSALRARWWLIRGQLMFGDSSKRDEQLAALNRSAKLFAEVAPDDPSRVTALADIGTVHANSREFAAARTFYDQSTALAETVRNRNDAELATIYGNVGMISLNVGDFAAAEEAYGRAEQVIVRTFGKNHLAHWLHGANRARAAHLGGDRERANTLFVTLMKDITPDSRSHQAFEAREWYGSCLAAEGRPAEAIPLLEQAERYYGETQTSDIDLPRVRLTLGDAYERAGRLEDARLAIEWALDDRIAKLSPQDQPLLAARERWGRFLLAWGEASDAEAQFREVLAQAQGRKLSHVALAHGGMARVALSRGDVDAALAASAQALELFEHVDGFRDVRMGPYLRLIRSAALLRSGDRNGARAAAGQALEERRRYDHAGAASIAEAEASLRDAGS